MLPSRQRPVRRQAGRRAKLSAMPVRVAVVGSLVLDHVVRVERFPAPGESVSAGDLTLFTGGKGANQAVAAARLGAAVRFVGRVGNDPAGAALKGALDAEGIDTSELSEVDGASGAALITLDAAGQNTIAVALGANLRLTATEVPPISTDAVLAQLETDPSAALAAMRQDAPVRILNPAPPRGVPDEIWTRATCVTPNEHEAAYYSGTPVRKVEDAEAAAAWFHDRGVPLVVVTLGALGAWVSLNGAGRMAPGLPVEAVDTVGAGDTFNGALAVRLAEGEEPYAAARFACAAAAVAVGSAGAQTGMPSRATVEALLAAHG